MIANRQLADPATAFTEAWDRGDHWRVAIRTSIATYDDGFQNLFQTELGSRLADYDLAEKPADASTPHPK